MSLKTLIASATLGVFLASFCLAEGVPAGPGKSTPVDPVTTVVAEPPLVLDSAPVEPAPFISMTAVLVKPTADSAEVVFSTNIPTYATIQYGLTAQYTNSLTTEIMTAHTETLSGLTACQKYSYRVLATSADDSSLDTARQGTFTTTGCIAKKAVEKAAIKTLAPVVAPVKITTLASSALVAPAAEEEMLALPVESDIVLNAAPNQMTNDNGIMNNENEATDDVIQAAPEGPERALSLDMPARAPVSKATETALALLGLLLLVGGLIVVRRKK